MSPTGERRDEGKNIRTRQNPFGPQERQTRISKASTTSCAKHRCMSERGETDSRSIGSSDKFRATAVRRNVVNHQTRGMMAQRRQLDMFTKGRIFGMLESS
ncbi:hypothetical protein TNCV_4627111 [Trichonephila clavipes]|nr:hypothetical protein TNCV_4627111 [Trichonephila clavipes]